MSFLSPVAEIDGIHFVKPKSGRPMNAEKIVVIDGMIVAKLRDRTCWCNWESLHKYALQPGEWCGKSLKLLRCLVALGMIQRKHLDAHMARVKQNEKDADVRSDRKEIQRIAKKYGVEIPIPEPLQEKKR